MKHSANPIPLYDKITVSQLYSTYVRTFPSNFRFDGERHNFWEIGYIVNGNVGITSDDRIYKCAQGDLVVHPPNAFHTCWGINKTDFSIFTVSFSCNSRLDLPPCKITLSADEQTLIDALIREISACFSQSQGEFYYNRDDELPNYGSHHYQILKNYLEILLLHIQQNEQIGKQSVMSEDAVKYNNIVNYLKKNVCRNLTVEEIAKELFESPGNLKRLFHKFTNMGIMKYFADLRLDYAIRQLEQGKSMRRIAADMDFSSQNYFSYFFKKATGQSPSYYQNATYKTTVKED